MGPGGTITAARAATARSALEAWGGALAGALDQAAPALRPTSPTMLEIGRHRLRDIPEGMIRSKGWELRHAFAWRNDDRCLQRAAFGAMSLAEEGAGSLGAAFGEAGLHQSWRGAVAVAYRPDNFGGARFHAATVARSATGETFVIDHLLTRADDGVLPLTEWLRRIGGRPETTRLVPPTHLAPLALSRGPGIPVVATPIDASTWRELADHLAVSWEDGARIAAAHVQPVANAA